MRKLGIHLSAAHIYVAHHEYCIHVRICPADRIALSVEQIRHGIVTNAAFPLRFRMAAPSGALPGETETGYAESADPKSPLSASVCQRERQLEIHIQAPGKNLMLMHAGQQKDNIWDLYLATVTA